MTIPKTRQSAKRLGLMLLALGIVPSATPASGQAFVPDPVEQRVFELQVEKPFFPGAIGLASYSSILEADVILPLSTTTSLRVGAPLAVSGADFVNGTSAYLGNIRASLLFGEPSAPSSFVSLTLPTAGNIAGPDLAVIVGVLPWLDEREKWLEDAVSLRSEVMPAWSLGSGGRLGFRLGGSALMPTDFGNLFVYARAAGWGRFPAGEAELRADLGTVYVVDSDDGFGEQFTAYLTVGAALPEVSGQPGIFVRVPLDGDARDVLDVSIGLRARF